MNRSKKQQVIMLLLKLMNKNLVNENMQVVATVGKCPRRKIVHNCTKETLNSKIIAKVKRNSNVYTGGWREYNLSLNFNTHHPTVNHSIGFVNSIQGTHTYFIESGFKIFRSEKTVISFYIFSSDLVQTLTQFRMG